MKITSFIVMGFSVVCSMTACSDDPVTVADPEPAVVVVKVPNGSFEEDAAETVSPKGWIISGDNSAVKVVEGGCEGIYALHYGATRYPPVRLLMVWRMEFMTLNFIIKVVEDKFPVVWLPVLIIRR